MITSIAGWLASILILTSMCFKTTTLKGTLIMRILNSFGSIAFVVYGMSVPAYATAITNGILFFVNMYYLIKEIKDNKKDKKE